MNNLNYVHNSGRLCNLGFINNQYSVCINSIRTDIWIDNDFIYVNKTDERTIRLVDPSRMVARYKYKYDKGLNVVDELEYFYNKIDISNHNDLYSWCICDNFDYKLID